MGTLAISWWMEKGSEGGWVFAMAGSVCVAAFAGNGRSGWLSFPFLAGVWGVSLLFTAFPGDTWLVDGAAASCLCFLAARGIGVSFRSTPDSRTDEFGEFLVSIFVLIGVGVLAFAVRGTWEAPVAVVLCALIYGVLVVAGLVCSLRSVAATAIVPLLVFWGIQGVLGPVQDVGLWGWVAFGLCLGIVWVAYRSTHYMSLVRIEGMMPEAVLIGHLAVMTLTGFATASQHGEGVKVALAAVIAVAMLPWAWSLQGGRGWRAPWYAGGVWLLWGSWHGILAFGEGWANEVLPGSLMVGAVLLAYPAIIKRLFPLRDRETFSAVTSFIGIVFLLLLFLTLSGQEQILRKLVTVCWAACALALVAVGLVERLKPFRIVGLVGLALCLIRVFWVDVQSTTWRIVAFIGLGGLLLVVGFLYTRFAERLLGDEPVAAESEPEETAGHASD